MMTLTGRTVPVGPGVYAVLRVSDRPPRLITPSTGGHFNPHGKAHAHHGSTERHAGDLPALRADASGKATFSVEMDVITVADGAASVIGRGLIVHVQADDYKTQPTGNAGARNACAVIRRA